MRQLGLVLVNAPAGAHVAALVVHDGDLDRRDLPVVDDPPGERDPTLLVGLPALGAAEVLHEGRRLVARVDLVASGRPARGEVLLARGVVGERRDLPVTLGRQVHRQRPGGALPVGVRQRRGQRVEGRSHRPVGLQVAVGVAVPQRHQHLRDPDVVGRGAGQVEMQHLAAQLGPGDVEQPVGRTVARELRAQREPALQRAGRRQADVVVGPHPEVVGAGAEVERRRPRPARDCRCSR